MITEARDAGRTVILSSPILSEIQHAADVVTVLSRGEIVAAGPVHSLAIAGVRDLRATLGGVERTQLATTLAHAVTAAWLGLAAVIGTISLAAGALTGRRSAAIGAGAAVAVVSYAFNAISDMNPDFEWMHALSPYYWAYGHAFPCKRHGLGRVRIATGSGCGVCSDRGGGTSAPRLDQIVEPCYRVVPWNLLLLSVSSATGLSAS